jgi:hypothetical protein
MGYQIFCCQNVATPGSHGGGGIGLDRCDVSIQLYDQFPDFNIVLHIQKEPV